MYDVIAQRLLEDHKDVRNKPTPVDALSWLSISLGKTGDSRYLGVLDNVRMNAGHRPSERLC